MTATKQVNGPSRFDLWRDAQGIIAETFPHNGPLGLSTAGTFVSGTLYGGQIYLFKGDIITSLSVQTTITVVTGQTSGFLALYDLLGNLVAATADTGAAFTTQGIHTVPVITPYVVPASGIYYAASLLVFATLVPELASVVVPNAARVQQPAPIAGFPIYMWNQAGLAALPNPATQPYANPGPPGFLWIAAS